MNLPSLTLKSDRHPTVYLYQAIPFLLVHLTCLFVFWTGVTTTSIVLCVSLYILRMWAVTAGYHRYFSHKSFKTSRVFQFILAFLAQTSVQRGILQWANDHRKHHIYSDTKEDSHSPRAHGLMYAHLGWIFAKETYDTDYKMVQDFKKYPELVWLNKYKHLPPIILAVLTWLIGGWSGLIVGFFISTVLVFHCTFFINSLTHRFGNQRYLTGDDSRNHWLLALLTFGEGWHNNHHYYPASVRQGFFWWEIDLTYYILKLLERLHIIWDLKLPTAAILQAKNTFSSRAITHSMRFLKNAGCDFGLVTTQLESAKNAVSPENCQLELQNVQDLLKQQLTLINNFPPKLKNIVKYNLESSIKLLSKLIDYSRNDTVLSLKQIAMIDEILALIAFQQKRMQHEPGLD